MSLLDECVLFLFTPGNASLAVVEQVVEAGCNAAGPKVGEACTFVIDHLQAVFDLVGQGMQPALICTKFGFCSALHSSASQCIVKYFSDAGCTQLGGGPPGTMLLLSTIMRALLHSSPRSFGSIHDCVTYAFVL